MTDPDITPQSAAAKWRERIASPVAFVGRNSVAFYLLVISLIFVTLLAAPKMFVVIPAGHVGVLWRPLSSGTLTDEFFSEGMTVILPWNEIVIYDTRLIEQTASYDAISSTGLTLQVEIAVRYRLDRDSIGLLHKLVGPKYVQTLLLPEVGSHARELISGYTPEQLYTETRAFIQAQILARMSTQLGSSLANQNVRGKMLHVEDVFIRSIQLPASVATAIERKAEQQQAMLEYDFRLERERKEAERKRIEAAGLRDFQAIVSNTITQEYLRLRGIEATMSLANSPNSKTVVIGGKDGLPLILNTGELGNASASKSPSSAAKLEGSGGGRTNVPASAPAK